MYNTDSAFKIATMFYIIAPIIGYIPQILTNNVSFPPFLSFIVVITNLLRIHQYFLNPINSMFFYQSILIVLIHNYIVYNFKGNLSLFEKRFFKLGLFYKTKGVYFSFLQLISTLSSITFLTLTFFSKSSSLIFVKYSNFILESFNGLIQLLFYKFDDLKREMPKELFCCWFVGDLCKIIMLMFTKAEPLVVLSVVFQIVINLVVLYS